MTDNDDVFREDDQAPLLEHLRKVNPALFEEKSPDGKPLMSHEFRIIDLIVNNDIRKNMRFIYPNVKVDLYKYPTSKVLIMQCDLRLKYRGKYYLTRCLKSWDLDLDIEGLALLGYTSQFHSEVFRYLKFMKVDLKMIIPGHFEPPKPVFELDPDQTPEEDRLILKA